MSTVKITINGNVVHARPDATILEASREDVQATRQYDVTIPMIQYLKGVKSLDTSGIALCEVLGMAGLVNASIQTVSAGMQVLTKTPAVVEAQKRALADILKVHDLDCRNCRRTGNCELQDLQWTFRQSKDPAQAKRKVDPIDESGIVVRDPNKCVRCGRCVSVCENVQAVGAIRMEGEGLKGRVVPVGAATLIDTKCVNCGQCIVSCPVGALRERDDVDEVLAAIAAPDKFVVVQTAPSMRAGMAEGLGYPIGSETEGKIVAALRAAGFDRVYDTDFSADLTIMEEAEELIRRLQGEGPLPMTTSCCPGWVKFAEQEFGDMLDHVSTCKSPHTMFGAIVKSYLAEKEGLDPKNIVVVSGMPCTAKKFECARPELSGTGVPDVDFVLTAREVASLLKRVGIPFLALPCESFDSPLGEGSGAGVIFGATGGVMEAALRTAADWLSGQDIQNIEYTQVRGIAGLKEAKVNVAGHDVRVAVASGLANAKALMEKVRTGEVAYDFIEVMACPGGCVNGGGMPQQKSEVRMTCDLRSERASVLYGLDEKATIRKAHDNPLIVDLYESYLGEVGSERAHQLLHTTYQARA